MMQSDLGKLFLGGISLDTNEDRLKEYFSSYGEVLETVIMKDRTTGRARGFGFIVFADSAVADLVTKEKHYIDGKMVEAKKAVPRDDQTNTMSRRSGSIQSSPPVRTKKIFIGGLASSVTESELKVYFEQFGTVTDGVVMYDHNTGRPRGFGFITYDSEDAVDQVLLQTFHELDGKIVEVKHAVPKNLSPSPNRSPLGGYNYSLGRTGNFLGGYNQGYLPGAAGGYGVRMDGRFSPITAGRGGFSPFGSGYGMGLNAEGGMNPNFGENANFNDGINYGRSMNPYFLGNSNRFTNSVGFDGGNGGNTSFFSSPTRNLWSNEGGLNSINLSGYLGSGSGSIGGLNFANTGLNWGSSPISPQGGGRGIVSNQGGNLGNGGVDNNYNPGGGYGRNIATTVAPMSSYAASNGGYDAAFADFYGDSKWRTADTEREEAGAFGYGLGSGASDIQFEHGPAYVDGYSVSKG